MAKKRGRKKLTVIGPHLGGKHMKHTGGKRKGGKRKKALWRRSPQWYRSQPEPRKAAPATPPSNWQCSDSSFRDWRNSSRRGRRVSR